MKMKRVLTLFCVAGFVGWCLSGCDPIQSHSEIPEIHYISLSFGTFNGLTDMAILNFSFVDGDGDIGKRTTVDKNGDIVALTPDDDNSKIHFTWYKKLPDRTYEPFQFASGTIADSTAIPYDEVMDKDGANNKTLKGTIQIALFPPTKPQNVDTMRIEFYIFDRARNKSNVEYTPDFSILNPPEEPLLKTKAAK